LKKPVAAITSPPSRTAPVVPSTSVAAGGYTFTTTNFDDGWTSTVQEDWVQVTKANIRVLIHYPNKNADKYNTLLQIQEDLQLQAVPVHIECFDNSNFQGSYPVSAMVCFKNGEPSKKDYRHFNVKTVEGINDFATMKEAVLRRYKRLKEEDQPLPQLVIIDGGKGQLGAANEAIEELELKGKMTLVGLAKNEEELFFVGDQQSLKLPYDSESHKLIRRIRDEVHRFGINFHRQKRSKGTFKNSLQDIKGIGSGTANILLKIYSPHLIFCVYFDDNQTFEKIRALAKHS